MSQEMISSCEMSLSVSINIKYSFSVYEFVPVNQDKSCTIRFVNNNKTTYSIRVKELRKSIILM